MDYKNVRSIFIDTAPIIYFVEGHSEFGQKVKDVFTHLYAGMIEVHTSVITLMEVLPKPVQTGEQKLVEQFSRLLKNRRNFFVNDITREIALKAGELRGKYSILKSMDALQLAVAIDRKVDVFLTNDFKLKQIKEITIRTMEDI